MSPHSLCWRVEHATDTSDTGWMNEWNRGTCLWKDKNVVPQVPAKTHNPNNVHPCLQKARKWQALNWGAQKAQFCAVTGGAIWVTTLNLLLGDWHAGRAHTLIRDCVHPCSHLDSTSQYLLMIATFNRHVGYQQRKKKTYPLGEHMINTHESISKL